MFGNRKPEPSSPQQHQEHQQQPEVPGNKNNSNKNIGKDPSTVAVAAATTTAKVHESNSNRSSSPHERSEQASLPSAASATEFGRDEQTQQSKTSPARHRVTEKSHKETRSVNMMIATGDDRLRTISNRIVDHVANNNTGAPPAHHHLQQCRRQHQQQQRHQVAITAASSSPPPSSFGTTFDADNVTAALSNVNGNVNCTSASVTEKSHKETRSVNMMIATGDDRLRTISNRMVDHVANNNTGAPAHHHHQCHRQHQQQSQRHQVAITAASSSSFGTRFDADNVTAAVAALSNVNGNVNCTSATTKANSAAAAPLSPPPSHAAPSDNGNSNISTNINHPSHPAAFVTRSTALVATVPKDDDDVGGGNQRTIAPSSSAIVFEKARKSPTILGTAAPSRGTPKRAGAITADTSTRQGEDEQQQQQQQHHNQQQHKQQQPSMIQEEPSKQSRIAVSSPLISTSSDDKVEDNNNINKKKVTQNCDSQSSAHPRATPMQLSPLSAHESGVGAATTTTTTGQPLPSSSVTSRKRTFKDAFARTQSNDHEVAPATLVEASNSKLQSTQTSAIPSVPAAAAAITTTTSTSTSTSTPPQSPPRQQQRTIAILPKPVLNQQQPSMIQEEPSKQSRIAVSSPLISTSSDDNKKKEVTQNCDSQTERPTSAHPSATPMPPSPLSVHGSGATTTTGQPLPSSSVTSRKRTFKDAFLAHTQSKNDHEVAPATLVEASNSKLQSTQTGAISSVPAAAAITTATSTSTRTSTPPQSPQQRTIAILPKPVLSANTNAASAQTSPTPTSPELIPKALTQVTSPQSPVQPSDDTSTDVPIVQEATAAVPDSSPVSAATSSAMSISSTVTTPSSNAKSQPRKRGSPNKKQRGQNTGRWTPEEHRAFLDGLKICGREWKRVASRIPTRTSAQIRSHAQKYFAKLQREHEEAAAAGMFAVTMMPSTPIIIKHGDANFQSPVGQASTSSSQEPSLSSSSSNAAAAMTGSAAATVPASPSPDAPLPASVQRNVERILANPAGVQQEVESTLEALRQRYRNLQRRLEQRQRRRSQRREQGQPQNQRRQPSNHQQYPSNSFDRQKQLVGLLRDSSAQQGPSRNGQHAPLSPPPPPTTTTILSALDQQAPSSSSSSSSPSKVVTTTTRFVETKEDMDTEEQVSVKSERSASVASSSRELDKEELIALHVLGSDLSRTDETTTPQATTNGSSSMHRSASHGSHLSSLASVGGDYDDAANQATSSATAVVVSAQNTAATATMTATATATTAVNSDDGMASAPTADGGAGTAGPVFSASEANSAMNNAPFGVDGSHLSSLASVGGDYDDAANQATSSATAVVVSAQNTAATATMTATATATTAVNSDDGMASAPTADGGAGTAGPVFSASEANSAMNNAPMNDGMNGTRQFSGTSSPERMISATAAASPSASHGSHLSSLASVGGDYDDAANQATSSATALLVNEQNTAATGTMPRTATTTTAVDSDNGMASAPTADGAAGSAGAAGPVFSATTTAPEANSIMNDAARNDGMNGTRQFSGTSSPERMISATAAASPGHDHVKREHSSSE
eukprot:CAMPEP_0119570724 /NCGR_PEP_ID=MMETSP1352-20130426/43755_1 /TAXON_ID=265584 /ORGANISM="Stauroneis constricta, Strain CCMP1120" /LENGTH=1558 /DNA_ID=CAMNT_0007620397 /DNA_START=139 /DNA_END=4818 /DNA_ORIENTATION=-